MALAPSSPCLAVAVLGDDLHVQSQSGEYRPILNGSEPLKPSRDFVSGWSALYVVDLGMDVFLLELRANSGHRATWFLDRTLNRIGDQFNTLPDLLRNQLLEIFLPYLHAVYHGILSSPVPSVPPGAEAVGLICEPTIASIVRAVMPHIAPDLRVRRPGSVLSDAEGFDHDSMAGSLQDVLDQGLGGTPLCWTSPFDGTVQHGADSISVSEHRIGYRFYDAGNHSVFYVGASNDVYKASDIFLPRQQCLLSAYFDDNHERNAASAVAEEYLTHAASHATALCHYLSGTTHKPAVIVRGFPGMHIGHHVWNELTALFRLQRKLPTDALPLVFVPEAGAGSEPFAPIEEILPAFAGRVDRTHAYRRETLGSLTYRNNLFLARSIDEHVATKLSRQIREACLSRPAARSARLAAQDYRDRGYTIIMLGMRVENRTSTDIVATAEMIIDHLSSRIEKLVVVFDGQNARLGEDPTTCYGSYGQTTQHHPLLREYEMVLRIRARYEYSDIRIISTIGASVPQSIAWCDASAAFVGCWGAGFAKYRWVCNKPGLALSGRWNLMNRHDLHIYDAPTWQEDPTPLIFIDPACVTDRPDLGVYFSIVNPVPITYSNFDIDPDGLRSHLDRLLESLPAALPA